MKVLVFCLFKQMYPATVESAYALQWPGLDYLFLYGKARARRRDALAEGRNEGKRLFLKGKWDAVLTVDSDMIVPPDAIEKLAQCHADIAYGLYCTRHGPSYNWTFTTEKRPNGEPHTSMSLKGNYYAPRFWDGMHAVTGKGWGCTLVQRHVMERVEIHARQGHASDHWLAQQANQEGRWSQVGHLGVRCGHILHKWIGGEQRGVVWPSKLPPYHRIEEAR